MDTTEIDPQNTASEFNQKPLSRIAVAILLLSILNLVWVLMIARSDFSAVVYPLVSDNSLFSGLPFGAVGCFAPFLFIIIILFIVPAPGRGGSPRPQLLKELSMTFVAVFITFLAVLMGWGSNSLQHVDSQHFDGRVYNLAAFREYDDLNLVPYFMYECDSIGIICNKVYQSPSQWLPEPKSAGSLVVDPETNSVSIVVNDETIYTHAPD